jgi:hypothetical protein
VPRERGFVDDAAARRLNKTAPGFMAASSASPIMPRVVAISGHAASPRRRPPTAPQRHRSCAKSLHCSDVAGRRIVKPMRQPMR